MRWILITASVLGALSVVIGAAARHMAGITEGSSAYDILQTGLRYHQIHSVVLLALGLFALSHAGGKTLTAAAVLFTAGIVLFSGSLYVAAVMDLPALTMMTPFGGTCFIAGWLCLAFIRPDKKA